MGVKLGDALTAVSKVNPAILGSGSTPSVGELSGFQYNITPISEQRNLTAVLEKNFLREKSKFLPNWLSVDVPISGYGNHKPLGSINKPSPRNAGYGESAPLNSDTVPGTWAGNGAIESIKSLARGFARPTKYRVLCAVPSGIPNNMDSYEVSLSCSGAVLPGLSLSTFDSRHGTPNIMKKPYDVIYEDVKLTFQISHEMKEHTLMESWMKFIYDEKTKDFAYPKDYYSDISIIQLDNAHNELKWISLIDAYPISMSEVTLSYDADNAIETFDVNFAYRYWETQK